MSEGRPEGRKDRGSLIRSPSDQVTDLTGSAVIVNMDQVKLCECYCLQSSGLSHESPVAVGAVTQ